MIINLWFCNYQTILNDIFEDNLFYFHIFNIRDDIIR